MTKKNFWKNGKASIVCSRLLLIIVLVNAFFRPGSLYAQTKINVAGIVTGESGQALQAVTVAEKNTSNATYTGKNGAFSIMVANARAVLVFSNVGFANQEVQVGLSKNVNVQLELSAAALNDVVITAYGKVKKSNLTDAVSTISAEKLEDRALRTLTDGLVGLAPGLNIRMPSGAPESSPSINIRGFTSINSSASPLILVDGVERPISDVNPNDVESISVLKDGGSTAIYGSRAPYGIILITTKSGKSGKISVSYSNNIKIGKMVMFPTQPNSPEWARYINIASRNGQPNGTGTDGVDSLTIAKMSAWLNKDWNNAAFNDLRAQFGNAAQSYIENGQFPISNAAYKNWTREQSFASNNLYDSYFNKTSLSQQHDINFSGGTDKLQYFSGFGYNATKGLLKGDLNYDRRYNFHTKLNYKAADWLDLRTDVSYVRQENQGPNYRAGSSTDNQNGIIADYANIFASMLQYFATPLRTPSGNQYSWILGAASVLGEGGLITNVRNDMVLTGGVTIRPVRHLEVNADYTWRTSNTDFTKVDQIAYTELPDGTRVQNNRSANVSGISKTYGIQNYQNFRLSAQYKTSFNNVHNLLVQVGSQAENNDFKSLSGSRTDLFAQSVVQALTSAANNQLASDNMYSWSVLGYYGVLTYDFKEKYMVKFAGRADASSRFSPASRWGYFPSVSAAWNIAKEAFWPMNDWINEMKPRASWSSSGDLTSVGSANYYTYLPTLAFGVNQNTLLGGNYANFATAPGLVSSTLTWAKPTVINVGVDLSGLKRRLSLSFDWYQRTVKDQVGPPNPLPVVLGTSAPQLNNSVSETRGWELTVGWSDQFKIADKPFRYDLRFNMSDYIGYVTQYSANKTGAAGSTWTPGQVFGQNFLYKGTGIAQNKSGLDGKTLTGTYNYPGYMMYADLNGDGYINGGNDTWYSRGDLTADGFNYPRKSVSFTPTASWNNFSLSLILEGVLQWKVYSSSELVWGTRAATDLAYFYTPAYKESTSLGYWSPDNTSAFFPAFNTSRTLATDQYALNLANLRVRNLTIGYNLPKQFISRLKLNRVNIYVSGENLGFIFNKSFIKYDPEMLSTLTGAGVNGFPPLRYYSFGVNVHL